MATFTIKPPHQVLKYFWMFKKDERSIAHFWQKAMKNLNTSHKVSVQLLYLQREWLLWHRITSARWVLRKWQYPVFLQCCLFENKKIFLYIYRMNIWIANCEKNKELSYITYNTRYSIILCNVNNRNVTILQIHGVISLWI